MTYSWKNMIHCATGASAVTVREVRARLAPPRSAPSQQAPGKGTLDTKGYYHWGGAGAAFA